MRKPTHKKKGGGCLNDFVAGLAFIIILGVFFMAMTETKVIEIVKFINPPKTTILTEEGQQLEDFQKDLNIKVITGTVRLLDTFRQNVPIVFENVFDRWSYFNCDTPYVIAKAYYTVAYEYSIYPDEWRLTDYAENYKIPVSYSMSLDTAYQQTVRSPCVDEMPTIDMGRFVSTRADSFMLPLKYAITSDSILKETQIQIHVQEDTGPPDRIVIPGTTRDSFQDPG